jgi:phospholipid/cholesterol/gamma-HCH transport system substrate-binding protein
MRVLNRRASHNPSRFTIVLAALGAVGVLLALTTVALVAPRGVPGLHYYEINAQFSDASQIADLSEVRIAGRHVGQVTGSELRNGRATVTLQLFPGQGPLRSDSTARVRLKGLLGAKFVDVNPSKTGRPLPSGSTLPAKQTSTAVELLDVLGALDAPTRRRLQQSVQGLGEGFLGRGEDINGMLAAAPGFFVGADQVSGSILARTGAAARFGPSAETLAAAYDPVRQELAAGFAPEARVLNDFVARRRALDGTVAEAPSSLEALRQGLSASVPMLDETAGLARATTRLTRPAPAAFRETSVFLHRAAPALRATQPLLQKLAGAVNPTLDFLKRVDPVIDPSVKALRNNLPPLLELGRRGCDVLNFARNWRSTLGFGVATGFGDPTGTLDEGQPGLGPLNSLRVLAVRPLDSEHLNADAPPSQDPTHGRNAYPAPCASITERLP